MPLKKGRPQNQAVAIALEKAKSPTSNQAQEVSKAPAQPAPIRAVEIRAEVRQIRTMADGTVNLVLNLPEDCREQVKVMIDWLGMEVVAVIESR